MSSGITYFDLIPAAEAAGTLRGTPSQEVFRQSERRTGHRPPLSANRSFVFALTEVSLRDAMEAKTGKGAVKHGEKGLEMDREADCPAGRPPGSGLRPGCRGRPPEGEKAA